MHTTRPYGDGGTRYTMTSTMQSRAEASANHASVIVESGYLERPHLGRSYHFGVGHIPDPTEQAYHAVYSELMPMSSQVCHNCTGSIAESSATCPHCGSPLIAPNVRAARSADNLALLNERYTAATEVSTDLGLGDQIAALERSIESSVAVIARSLEEVRRLASSEKQLYGTYYRQIDSQIRLPDGDNWEVLRRLADSLLFPGYEKEIGFAALSLDGRGLWAFGDCSIQLRESMISNRSSVFVGNSATFFRDHDYTPDAALGYRADWERRGVLCVAKLAPRLDSCTESDGFARLLLEQSASGTDEFVEVHIYGPFSINTIEAVRIRTEMLDHRPSVAPVLESQLREHGVRLEVVS